MVKNGELVEAHQVIDASFLLPIVLWGMPYDLPLNFSGTARTLLGRKSEMLSMLLDLVENSFIKERNTTMSSMSIFKMACHLSSCLTMSRVGTFHHDFR